MSETRRIHHATDEDLDALAHLMADSPLLHRYAVTETAALEQLRLARAEGDLLLVVRDAEEDPPRGFAWVIFTRAFDTAAYLRLLLIDGTAQRTGAGSQLMREVEAQASRHARHL